MYEEILLPRGAKHQEPDRVIVHAMGEYIDGVHASSFLMNVGLSAHILVCPDGKIIRCRQDNQGAYHARKHNVNSLGIEFLVVGNHGYASFKEMIKEPYLTSEQYEAGMEFVRDEWFIKKGIRMVDRHSDVSPERKVDPGEGFPWERFKREVGIL
jgi:N-acetylmuramoyl-L-alanine amidase